MKHTILIGLLVSALSLGLFGQETITIYPDKDANLVNNDNNPDAEDDNFGSNTLLRAWEWTSSGLPYQYKGLIGIDLSSLPENAFVLEAKLFLYGTGDHNSYVISGSGYQPNDCYLRRVTTSWNENTVTWNTAPYTATGSQVIIPSSTTSDQDYEIDVTNLIKQIQNNPTSSDGLMLELVDPLKYTDMCFASSDHATSSLHPKLEITYNIGSYIDNEGFELAVTKWDNIEGDDLDWILKAGTTPSFGTGPSGAYEGNTYAYVEASSPNYPSKIAYLESEEYFIPEVDNVSLNFDYHMYGAAMGQLWLFYSTNHGSSWNSCWASSGDQGDSWHRVTEDLSFLTGESIIFRFKAITGSNYTSDICVDNIWLSANNNPDLSTDQNYVYTKTLLSNIGASGPKIEDVLYIDGLGRQTQRVGISTSPEGNDLIVPIEFDNQGRIVKDYLAFSADDDEIGSYRDGLGTGDDVFGMQESFYQDHFSLGSNNPYAYSSKVFESTPLSRVIEQGSPGEAWQPIEEKGGSVENVKGYTYGTNIPSEVRYYFVSSTGVLSGGSTYYAADKLIKLSVSDEDSNVSEEFTDKLGRVVLKRSWDDSTQYSTFYVYDEHGLLRFVLPPKADADNGMPTTTEIEQLCYQYKYDSRNRMIEKQIPGAEPIYMVYDRWNRLVATQDGEMKNSNQWFYTKYDVLNRPVITGIMTTSSNYTRSDIQYEVDWHYSQLLNRYENRIAIGNGYSDRSYPSTGTYISSKTVLTVTYYDNYNHEALTWFTGPTFENTDAIDSYYDDDGNSNGYFDRVNNQITGIASVLVDGVFTDWVFSSNYYDDKYRIIQTQSSLHPQGTGMTSTKYDFTGKILESLEIQDVNSIENKIRYTHTYDHAGRLTEVYMYFNNENAVLLAQNSYNELGELKEKNLHSTDHSTFTQSVDYKYNIRGWLKGINDPESLSADGDLFGITLFYDDLDVGLGSTPAHNGNISGVLWGRTGSTYAKAYTFTYDELNRIENSDFKRKLGVTWFKNTYYETSYLYDLNGNISSLTRKNSVGTTIDNLSYTYDGNQLDEVVDAGSISLGAIDDGISGTDYDYDDNGNMEWDRNKNIKVDYNFLNLPKKVYEESGTGDEILYIYDATGIKRLKSYDDGSSLKNTMYAGSFVYEDNDGDAVDDFGLDYILNPEGKIANISTSFEYQYHLNDHLGNTRVVFDASGSVEQAPDYYPYGMLFSTSLGGDNEYLFNGKEIQDEQLGGVNLDWYDYGARFYDPALGRWHVPDPLTEEAQDWSPYRYSYNNPVFYIDPTGLLETKFEDENGNLISEVDDGSNAVFKTQGEGADKHYDFKEFDDSQGGENNINVTSVIEAQQEMNMNNENLMQNDLGTWCNRATRNVLSAVESGFSAMNYMSDADLSLPIVNANKMIGDHLEGNAAFTTVSLSKATEKADKGHLVIAAWKNPNSKSSGHLATFSVGSNKSKGLIANIGTTKWTGYQTLGGTFTKEQQKSVQYFMINYKKP